MAGSRDPNLYLVKRYVDGRDGDESIINYGDTDWYIEDAFPGEPIVIVVTGFIKSAVQFRTKIDTDSGWSEPEMLLLDEALNQPERADTGYIQNNDIRWFQIRSVIKTTGGTFCYGAWSPIQVGSNDDFAQLLETLDQFANDGLFTA